MGEGTMKLAVRAKRTLGAAAVAVIAAAGFGAMAGEAQAIVPSDPAYTASRAPVTITGCKGVQITVEARERDLIDMHNAHRAKVGGPRLCVDPSLQRAAEAHARDMIARNYLGHTSPEGTTPAQRAARAGYKGEGVGENAARNYAGDTASDLMNLWIGSPGHRENIELDYFLETGIASADSAPEDDDPDDTYPAEVMHSRHVAMFAHGTDAPAPAPAPAPKPAPNAAPAISGVKPAAGSATRDRTPLASARITDTGTKLAASHIKVYVDGRRARVIYNAATGSMKAQLSRLRPGKHSLRIIATDGQLSKSATSRFTVR